MQIPAASVPFKILERLIYARVEPIMNLMNHESWTKSWTLLPQEQTGFRHGSSVLDQVTLLIQDIEDSFSAKKAKAVFVDLTAAYDIASRLHLQATAIATWQHSPHDHEDGWQSQLHPHYQQRQTHHVTNEASITASHRDPSWNPLSSTSIPLTCQTPSPESVHILMT